MINATKGANLLTHIFKFITSKWGKWITLTTWMTGSIILIMAAPVLKESTQATDWLPNSAESTKAFNISVEQFPQPGLPVIIVIVILRVSYSFCYCYYYYSLFLVL